MKSRKVTTTILIVGMVLAILSACQKQEGLAEQAGKEIDKAMDKTGQQIEKTGEGVQDAAKGDKK